MASCGSAGGTGNTVNIDQVLLGSPANGEIGIPVDYELTWSIDDTARNAVFSRSSSIGISEYRVYFAENTEEGYPVDQFPTLETKYSLSGLKAGTCYKWQIEAVLENGTSKKSKERTFTTTTGNGIRLIPISAGTFQMGDEYDVGNSNEKPVHNVTLTHDYYIGTFEVTNAEFVQFLNDTGVILCGNNGYIESRRIIGIDNNIHSGIDHNETSWVIKNLPLNYAQMPVVNISWWGAVEYCNWLSRQEEISEAYVWDETFKTYRLSNYPDNNGYRLPTEAEWEYAARGGQDYKYAGTFDIDLLESYTWYFKNSDVEDGTGKHAQVIGQKLPNGYGVHDMSGNVCEMCSDNWCPYSRNSQVDPYYRRPDNTSYTRRLARGGGWGWGDHSCRVATRCGWSGSDYHYSNHTGFRLVKTNPF